MAVPSRRSEFHVCHNHQQHGRTSARRDYCGSKPKPTAPVRIFVCFAFKGLCKVSIPGANDGFSMCLARPKRPAQRLALSPMLTFFCLAFVSLLLGLVPAQTFCRAAYQPEAFWYAPWQPAGSSSFISWGLKNYTFS